MYTVAVFALLSGGLTAQDNDGTASGSPMADGQPVPQSHTTMNAGLPPERITPVPNLEANADEPNTFIDLSGHFTDPEDPQTTLAFDILYNAFPAVAGVTINDQQLQIDYISAGQTTIVLKASNNDLFTTDTFAVGVRPVISGDIEVATLDDLPLAPDSYWNGSDGSGGFTSGPAIFSNSYNPDWFAWSGWAYSSMTDNTTPGYANQYSAFSNVRIDSANGKNYGVTYASPWSEIRLDPWSDQEVKGCFVTNSTWTALSMKHGDDFSKKFGGPDGTDPDFLKLTITGIDTDGNNASVDYYLADFRDADSTKDYIIETWQWVDLTPLGKVSRLQFAMSSSDNGDWGMNTPAYFCLDNLVVTQTPPQSPYIAEVLEYVPAPSQYMNTLPWSAPSSPASITGGINGSLSLGAFGGYVVFRFEKAVKNDPDNPFGVDFTIFGNPMPNWSEPGIVSVMKDENGNGQPDDTWYELAGADHNFSSTTRNYSVTYENPGADSATDVPWTDNLGNTGAIAANSFFSQPYYPMQDSFPGIPADSYTLSGTMIRSTVDTAFATTIYSLRRAFGYADNQFRGKAPFTLPDNPYTPAPENAGGDAFDISWAVDAEGNYVALDRVHFIRVHCAVNDGAGWLGQISTEITGAVMTIPDPSVTGTGELVVIREIPPVLDTTEYQLEVFAFTNGRLDPQEQIRWSSNMPGAVVDEQNILHVSNSGELTITASLASDANVRTSVSTFIDLVLEREERMSGQAPFSVYPNPASDYIMLKGLPGAPGGAGQITGTTGPAVSTGTTAVGGAPLPVLRIFDIAGRQVMMQHLEDPAARLQVRDLPAGLYMVTVTSGNTRATAKFTRQ